MPHSLGYSVFVEDENIEPNQDGSVSFVLCFQLMVKLFSIRMRGGAPNNQRSVEQ